MVVSETTTIVLLALNVVIAGLVVAAVARYGNRRELAAYGTAVAAWLAVMVVLAQRGTFVAKPQTVFPWIAVAIAAPVVAGAELLARSPSFRRLAAAVPLAALVGVQLYRVVGAVFLFGMHDHQLPGVFAWPAGVGDVLVGLSAPVVAVLVARRVRGAWTAAVVWCVAGIGDLVLAVAMGFLSSPSRFQALAHGHANLISHYPYALVPVFAVPVSLVLHFVVIWRATLDEARPMSASEWLAASRAGAGAGVRAA